MINTLSFYAQYHGHPLQDLEIAHAHFRQKGKHIVWLVGDSSLDNKHWLYGPQNPGIEKANLYNAAFADALNGWENLLVRSFVAGRQHVPFRVL